MSEVKPIRRPSTSPPFEPDSGKQWPIPLGEAAYHGPLGAYVRAIEPHTEADPAAVLVQALVCVGNATGRGPHFMLGQTRHAGNLNALIVGDTASARKGTSWTEAFAPVGAADPEWGDRNNGDGGLSSGEGLIHAVCDPHGDAKGVSDKRLLATMGEFSETLTRMRRESNTLSSTLRNAWDGKTLQTRTREPIRATGAHISVIGHITQADIARNLDRADVWNGFANRFLWVAAKKSRSLPFGGDTVAATRQALPAVRSALEWAQLKPRRIEFSTAARKRWADIYVDLNDRQPPGLEHLLGRSAPQVRRMALIYAVLDQSKAVDLRHLSAALEIWRYSEQTVEYLFSDLPPGKTRASCVGRSRRLQGDG